ncbi:MAG: hypothetical protein ACRCUE_04455 [Bosea sp. (in: a-proteobacteria)]
MCFMSDISSQQDPILRVTPGGGIDFDHYRRLAWHERIKAQRAAFGAIGLWLRELFSTAPVAPHHERLG